MLDLAIRGTLILVFAFAAASVMRRASAAARHLLWASALGGLLVLPALVRLSPAVEVPVPMLASAVAPAPAAVVVNVAESDPAAAPVVALRARVRSHVHARTMTHVMHAAPSATASRAPQAEIATDGIATGIATDGIATDETPELAAAPSNAPVAHDRAYARSAARIVAGTMSGVIASTAGTWQSIRRNRWAIWITGVLLVLGRLLLGVARVRAIVRDAAPVTDPAWVGLLESVADRLGVRRRVMLRAGAAGAVPVTCGIVSPVIILPEEAEDWDDERRELVLTHELAHVRRLDVLTHIIGQCAVALFWFHPLAWIAAARMRLERERACDDLVIVAGVRPSRYAGDLLDLVQTLNGATAPAAAALAMARRTEIEGRLLSILDAAVRRGPLSTRRVAGALAMVGMGVVTIAAVRPVAPAREDVGHLDPAIVVLPAVSAQAVAPQATMAAVVPVMGPAAGGGYANYTALADIAAAAATIASDAVKREVLFEIGERYGASDTLRHAFFAATNTIASSTERRRVLLALVGTGQRDKQTMIEVVRSAANIASDHDKAVVLRTVAGLDPLADPALRHEFFEAVSTLASSAERTHVLLAVLGEARARGHAHPTGNAIIARLALSAATALPSTSDKVRVLRAVVHGGWLSDATVAKDFNICLSTLGSQVDYHYVVSGGGD